jgi:hypothetical protein
MGRRVVRILAFTICALLLAASGIFAQEKQSPAKPKNPPAKTAQSNLTGCVDEQDGRYILITDQNRSLIAHLEAEGFPIEGFAKHVGHKVTVRGTSTSSGTDRPVFKVRSIETVSDACGPQH